MPANTENFQDQLLDAFEQILTPAVQAVLINTPNNPPPRGSSFRRNSFRQMADIKLLQKGKRNSAMIWLISHELYAEIAF